jgi:hypothetical protein
LLWNIMDFFWGNSKHIWFFFYQKFHLVIG